MIKVLKFAFVLWCLFLFQILLSVDLAAEINFKKTLVEEEQHCSFKIFRYTVQTKDFLMRNKASLSIISGLCHELNPDHYVSVDAILV